MGLPKLMKEHQMIEGILKDTRGIHMAVKDSLVLPIIIRRRILSRNPNRDIPSLGKVKMRQTTSASFVVIRVIGSRSLKKKEVKSHSL